MLNSSNSIHSLKISLTNSNEAMEAVILATDGFSVASGSGASTDDGDRGASKTEKSVDG